jgi:hypothetical protein
VNACEDTGTGIVAQLATCSSGGGGGGTTPPPEETTVKGCWLNSYGRGVGTVPDTCPPNSLKDGALCYPACESGYVGVAFVCW